MAVIRDQNKAVLLRVLSVATNNAAIVHGGFAPERHDYGRRYGDGDYGAHARQSATRSSGLPLFAREGRRRPDGGRRAHPPQMAVSGAPF